MICKDTKDLKLFKRFCLREAFICYYLKRNHNLNRSATTTPLMKFWYGDGLLSPQSSPTLQTPTRKSPPITPQTHKKKDITERTKLIHAPLQNALPVN
ncbi:hypothetical protein CEXT_721891 [Caerostris extrusa]|uniref:Uncharacterized protein n=1 Tax=Caerostris extrusa TaxID=172846 RepID=A0AAV4R832_CAEEX|nr:hypothetical protein CEXT_721891 [Caerostris extrusa]